MTALGRQSKPKRRVVPFGLCYVFGSFPLSSHFAILPADNAMEPTNESANVCTTVTTVTSEAIKWFLCHGISVTTSGRFTAVRDSPGGFFVDGIPAFERARHIRSFRAWCLGIRPVASLQERPRNLRHRQQHYY